MKIRMGRTTVLPLAGLGLALLVTLPASAYPGPEPGYGPNRPAPEARPAPGCAPGLAPAARELDAACQRLVDTLTADSCHPGGRYEGSVDVEAVLAAGSLE